MTSSWRYVQCTADPFQNLNRGFVIPPLELGCEWIVIFSLDGPYIHNCSIYNIIYSILTP